MAELEIGTKVKDRYTLKEFKGSGSFGEVWLAHDELLDSDVAIKIYISLDPRGIQEFISEYNTTQGISHPNLLTTTYVDIWERRPFLIMKYCAKGSSSALAGKIDENALWHFIHDVAAGLNYLHNMPDPIIHQDIKPDNILVDDTDRYLITDFGISKKIRSTMRKLSKRAVGAGAAAYMGPERFESNPTPVKASDIWSLGASIYELATGELPFCGLGGGMQKNGAEMPTLDSKWSKEMIIVMQSCLAKETWDRPTAQQLEEYSDAIIKGKAAKVTWNMPTGKVEDSDQKILEPATLPVDENDDEDETNTTGIEIWVVTFSIVATIIFLILIWPSNSSDKEADTCDSIAVEAQDDVVPGVDSSVVYEEVDADDYYHNIPEVKTEKTSTAPTTSQANKGGANVKQDKLNYDSSFIEDDSYFSVSDTELSFSRYGGSETITVYGTDWSIFVRPAPWVHISYSGNKIAIYVGGNNSNVDRTDYFILRSKGKKIRINVKQYS